jgi:hypothetical protein
MPRLRSIIASTLDACEADMVRQDQDEAAGHA